MSPVAHGVGAPHMILTNCTFKPRFKNDFIKKYFDFYVLNYHVKNKVQAIFFQFPSIILQEF